MTEECGDHGGTNRRGEPCGKPAGWGVDFDTGKCRHHRGTNEDGSSHEGNDFAVTHGAFREFFTGTLTDAETQMVKNAEELLGDDASAQSVGRTAAALCLAQWHRLRDERFMRRFESLCDTFSIAPEDVERLEHTGEGGGPIEVTINRERYDA